jgi:hypothetical protein
LRKSARRRNSQATVRLVNPAATARRLLELTGLESAFPIRSG